MRPREEQLLGSEKAYWLLKKYGIAYLAWQERTGKTLTAILTAEKSPFVKKVLVITKKAAIKGWEDTLAQYSTEIKFTLINYHSVDKVKGDFDLIILDEAHSYISSYPKTSVIWSKVKAKTKNKPILYLSATPYAQGPQLLFHQLALSSYSPWVRFANFYDWFKVYAQLVNGRLPTTRITNIQEVVDYKKVDENKVLADVEHLFLTRTRDFEHEPEDCLHYIELSVGIREVYNRILKEKILPFTNNDKDYVLNCDTTAKLRYALHMLEGGTLKIDNEYVILGNREKIDFILSKWGDTEDVVIMYNYIGEKTKLERVFKHARLLQATSYAEGVDLSMHKHLIIYSQDFSTARHTQRRARQANMNRKEPIKVHFLLVKKAASEQVYKTVSVNKVNFVDKLFKEETL